MKTATNQMCNHVVSQEFPVDKRGTPILDAAGIDVLRAWRYFAGASGDNPPSIVTALLVIAWAIKGGK